MTMLDTRPAAKPDTPTDEPRRFRRGRAEPTRVQRLRARQALSRAIQREATENMAEGRVLVEGAWREKRAARRAAFAAAWRFVEALFLWAVLAVVGLGLLVLADLMV